MQFFTMYDSTTYYTTCYTIHHFLLRRSFHSKSICIQNQTVSWQWSFKDRNLECRGFSWRCPTFPCIGIIVLFGLREEYAKSALWLQSVWMRDSICWGWFPGCGCFAKNGIFLVNVRALMLDKLWGSASHNPILYSTVSRKPGLRLKPDDRKQPPSHAWRALQPAQRSNSNTGEPFHIL